MERGSNQHGARVDDELAHESDALLHSSAIAGREREDLEPEALTAEEELALIELPGSEASAESTEMPAHADVIARSELARWLLPSAFPARAATLATVARRQHAPDEVVASLESLGTTGIFETVGELWVALGGREERRATADDAEPPPAPELEPAPAHVAALAPPPADAPRPVTEIGTAPVTTPPSRPVVEDGEPLLEVLFHLITLPPRIALGTVRLLGHALGRGVAAITNHPSS
jgi:hypothetical protein